MSPNLSQFYVRCGVSNIPNKPISFQNGSLVGTFAEPYAELLKSFHALSSSIGNSCITFPMYNVQQTATQGVSGPCLPVNKAGNTAIDTYGNAFAIGIELQSFSNRNDTILSGLNTLNTSLFMTAIIGSGQTAVNNTTIDIFAQMDMILVLQDGLLSAKY